MTSTPSLLRISAIASTTFIDPHSHSSAIRTCVDPAFLGGVIGSAQTDVRSLWNDELAGRVACVDGARNRIALRIKPELPPHHIDEDRARSPPKISAAP